MRRFLTALCALFWLGTAHAQWIKPTNTLVLPLAEPVEVHLVMTDESLGYSAYVPRGTISPLGDALAAESIRGQEEKHLRPAVARFNAAIPGAQRADQLAAAVRESLATVPGLQVASLTVHRGVAPGDVPRGDGGRRVLLLIARQHMAYGFFSLDVELEARYGLASEVFKFQGKPKLLFAQTFTASFPRPAGGKGGGIFGWMEQSAASWEALGPDAVAGMVDAGLRDVASMLAYELQRRPRFGRLSGKQLAVGDTYGVVEHVAGDRAWVRLRNGRLGSLPKAHTE